MPVLVKRNSIISMVLVNVLMLERVMMLRTILLLLLVLGNTACDRKPVNESYSYLLLFAEEEADIEPYQTRVLLTPDYLRFDDGDNSTEYVIFDRKKKTIYSVANETRTVIVVEPKTHSVQPPFALKLAHLKLDDMQDAPSIGGNRPKHYQFKSIDETCYETLSVIELLPEYIQAKREFNQILANDSAQTLLATPADMQNGCEMAKSTFAPNRHFEFGFPVRMWKEDEYSKTLLDYKKDYVIDAKLFTLPANFRRLTVDEIRRSKSFK